jgi:hypothetical protein
VRCADLRSLRIKQGAQTIEEFLPTGKYRLLKNGNELVGETTNRAYINQRMREDHQRQVLESLK